MARIRSIKPELPQSESMGNISRDARLLFILTWTIADDSGRLRGNSRMLASLLFPYDNDAPDLIDNWLNELVEEGCIIIYSLGNSTYIQIVKWLNHQKIDRPSVSKIPEFDESARILANPRVRIKGSKDQGSKDQGSKDQGSKDQGKDAVASFVEPQKNKTQEFEIFEHWKKIMSHKNAVFDDKRKKIITAALKFGYSQEQLKEAITGCSFTPHNMGSNEHGSRYDGVHLIFRDSGQIERFIHNCKNPPSGKKQQSQQKDKPDYSEIWENQDDVIDSTISRFYEPARL